MKSIQIKLSNSGNYIEVTADVTVDTFGTQHVTFIKENLNGSKHELFNTTNDEGSHMSPKALVAYYNGRVQ